MRFLFLCLLVYVIYRVLRGLGGSTRSQTRAEHVNASSPVDDIMVKDPFCQTYIPKREAIRTIIDGETVYFCSQECRDRYLEAQRADPGHTHQG
ncbi:MAG: hypothetical protein JRI36_07775 [Deltaproteobacteria bacterium]|nr:hypothetical protein [Deltaproteobacteria bacterium]